MAMQGAFDILGQMKSWLEALGLTFLAGGIAGYGLRSVISKRRHRRARAKRRLQHGLNNDNILTDTFYLNSTSSSLGLIQQQDPGQSSALAPDKTPPQGNFDQ